MRPRYRHAYAQRCQGDVDNLETTLFALQPNSQRERLRRSPDCQ